MIICIDSNTFIWGIKKKADPGQEDMIPRAEYLFKWADENRHNILIPTVVLAEVLAPEPLEKYPVLLDIISKNFMVVDFDQRAASCYGQLFMNKIEASKKVAKKQKIDNQKMKIDHLIISCALVHNAACIYSTDKGLKAFGQKYIDVRDLPQLPLVQTDLFGTAIKHTPTKKRSKKKEEDEDDLPF